METTTLLLIIFSVILVLGLILYFWPKIKKILFKAKEKKPKQKKHFVKETEVLNEKTTSSKEKDTNDELVSLKDFLKIPPEKIMEQGGGGVTLSPPQNKGFFDPEAVPEDDPFEGDDEIFEREKYWDDDLSRRLYVEDRKPKKTSPFEIYERSKEKSAKDELKNLSPQMKKILLSDLLKKKD